MSLEIIVVVIALVGGLSIAGIYLAKYWLRKIDLKIWPIIIIIIIMMAVGIGLTVYLYAKPYL